MQLKQIQIIVLACVFALQFVAEHFFPQKKEINNWRNERFNILVGLLNLALSFIPASFFVKSIYFFEERGIGLMHQFALPFWLRILLAILIMDAWMYVWHRWNHLFPFLWKFHSFHHKDTNMNSTTALRFHVVELFFSYPGKLLVCFIFGIGYVPLLIYEMMFFASIVIHHSNIYITERVDALYRIMFASPLMHRIHHSNKWAETNSNYGALFSFWDRLFGSWKAKPTEMIVFGLPENEQSK